jgi:16S rRNA (cytosine967-C5)-methyltransferase
LAPGGVLVYATCSVFLCEGELAVQAFLRRHNNAQRGVAPGAILPAEGPLSGEFNDNPRSGYDGFFYARLEKTHA